MTKFHVHGFFVVEAKDADEAGDWFHSIVRNLCTEGLVEGYQETAIYHVGDDDE